jgi:hypothetical protein
MWWSGVYIWLLLGASGVALELGAEIEGTSGG